MVIQRFCRAYMESPPPAVIHYKYQSYKYERNTAGKSAREEGVKPVGTKFQLLLKITFEDSSPKGGAYGGWLSIVEQLSAETHQ